MKPVRKISGLTLSWLVMRDRSTQCHWHYYSCFLSSLPSSELLAKLAIWHKLVTIFCCHKWLMIILWILQDIAIKPLNFFSLCDVFTWEYLLCCIEECIAFLKWVRYSHHLLTLNYLIVTPISLSTDRLENLNLFNLSVVIISIS